MAKAPKPPKPPKEPKLPKEKTLPGLVGCTGEGENKCKTLTSRVCTAALQGKEGATTEGVTLAGNDLKEWCVRNKIGSMFPEALPEASTKECDRLELKGAKKCRIEMAQRAAALAKPVTIQGIMSPGSTSVREGVRGQPIDPYLVGKGGRMARKLTKPCRYVPERDGTGEKIPDSYKKGKKADSIELEFFNPNQVKDHPGLTKPGPYLRICKAPGLPGGLYPVDSLAEAQSKIAEYRACRKSGTSTEKCLEIVKPVRFGGFTRPGGGKLGLKGYKRGRR